jgi:hypothetical protein
VDGAWSVLSEISETGRYLKDYIAANCMKTGSGRISLVFSRLAEYGKSYAHFKRARRNLLDKGIITEIAPHGCGHYLVSPYVLQRGSVREIVVIKRGRRKKDEMK